MINVAIVEDEDEIRESLAIIIDNAPGFRCCQTFSDCESAIEELEQAVEVVLMDIRFAPGRMSGIEGVRKIKALRPQLDIVMLTVYEDSDKIFESLRAGACGYLLKNIEPAELIENIREVHEGGAPMSSRIARQVVGSFQAESRRSPLTERQREILNKLREGKTYRVIGEELYISENTVKCHIKKIYETLHVHTQAEAIAKAMKDRLL